VCVSAVSVSAMAGITALTAACPLTQSSVCQTVHGTDCLSLINRLAFVSRDGPVTTVRRVGPLQPFTPVIMQSYLLLYNEQVCH